MYSATPSRQLALLITAVSLSQLPTVAHATQTAPDASATSADTWKSSGTELRTEENVDTGFHGIGGRLNLAYQKALSDNPNLQGTVTVQLVIAVDGSVSSCTITKTELNNAGLETKICVIVEHFNFGMAGNVPWTGKYKIVFLHGG